MRLGASGLGVIAAVSLLVTAAPEKNNGRNEESRESTDYSRMSISWLISGVVSLTNRIEDSRNRFLEIDHDRSNSLSRFDPSSIALSPSFQPAVHESNVRSTLSEPEDLGFPAELKVTSRASPQAQNFEGLTNSSSNRRNANTLENLKDKPTRNTGPESGVTVVQSTGSRMGKFGVTLDPPVSKFISGSLTTSFSIYRDPHRRHERETVPQEGETKSQGRHINEGSKRNEDQITRIGTGISRDEESSTTMKHRPTTITPTGHVTVTWRPNVVNVNFRNTTERTTEENSSVDKSDSVLYHSTIEDSTNVFAKENRSNLTNSNDLKQGDPVRDLTAVKERETTPKIFIKVTTHEQENLLDSSVTERTSRAKQITRESLPDFPIIGTDSLRYEKNISNTSSADIDASILDNHKAIKARSFQTLNVENEKRDDFRSGPSSVPSRFPGALLVKGSAVNHLENALLSRKAESLPHTANQPTLAKSVHAFVKNNTKQSVNLLDGESNKIFYEIKPSLITDMDRSDDVDFTTTTKRSFEKFLLPSVPSALGKFGPYFLDEEDRRNVTERIGNTVQLDCRIGMLGHRKVTWLQHYKDSFRLLTVERESYSVDRRISLNFQYPDNWRLQIAYASLRDSGLYKCQVEIDQDKSLVKRYNVIITAPILTITDDSGRPVSGERHLKAGSTLKLRCEARDVSQRHNESVLWMRGDETLTDDVSENRTTEIVNEKEIAIVTSTLLVERAAPSHAGNYSCIVPDKARTTVAIHVLNGELPAAVQHGSGVSTAVLNIWLVHLTASYGFLR